mgnify:CR=1 FL=1|jgi:hypothetical protein
MGNDIKSLEVHEFICRFKESIGKKNAKFCFFLGAGCSVSSGIPTAGEIVNNIWIPMLRGLKAKNKENFETWFKNRFPEYDESIAALFYGEIIEELFPYPKERQQEIERLVAEKDPGFGYAILAQLLAEKCGERCNIILTTNFDDMIADALYLYTNKKPIIVSHEALVGFIKISDTRPLVIKLHGDSKFFPLNTPRETKELNDNIKKVMKTLFSETGLIFIGYGGNDKSIIEILKEVPNDESFFQWGIYWIGQKLPTNEMGEFLTNRNAIWVNHRDFDELMLLLKDEFGFKLPTEDRFKKLFYTNFKTFQELEGKIHTKLDSIEKDTLEKAFEETSKEFASMTPLLNEELLKHSKTNFNNFCEEYRKKTKKILIIGDVFLNHTLVGIQAKYSDVQKHTIISRGGGVYTVNVETETLGGAAYLALALSEISHVILISVIGLDHEGNTLIKKCKDHKIQFNPIETIEVKTTTRAYINQLADDCDRGVLRFDNEDIKSMTRYCNSENVQDTIINKIKEYTNSIDCIVIKDYEKGVISEKLVKKIAKFPGIMEYLCM